jgi:hypothetical protein
MQVLPIKRPNSCGIGARDCGALCAAMMTQFLYRPSCSFRLGVAPVGRNCARASCTSWCSDTRGLCAQQWFGLGDECPRLSFERSGTVLCVEAPASVCTSVANCCYLRADCCRTVCMGRGGTRVCQYLGREPALEDSRKVSPSFRSHEGDCSSTDNIVIRHPRGTPATSHNCWCSRSHFALK